MTTRSNTNTKKARRRTVGISLGPEDMAIVKEHEAENPQLDNQSAAVRDILRVFKAQKEAARG